MLAILAFAIIIWISEAMDYSVSSIVISALIIYLVGSAPDISQPHGAMGTQKALKLAMAGFSNSALALWRLPCSLRAAMSATGLDRRIALLTMSRLGAGSRRLLTWWPLLGLI